MQAVGSRCCLAWWLPDVSFGVEQGGEVVPLPVAPTLTVGTDAIAGTGTYECRPDGLSVTFEGVTSILDRIG